MKYTLKVFKSTSFVPQRVSAKEFHGPAGPNGTIRKYLRLLIYWVDILCCYRINCARGRHLRSGRKLHMDRLKDCSSGCILNNIFNEIFIFWRDKVINSVYKASQWPAESLKRQHNTNNLPTSLKQHLKRSAGLYKIICKFRMVRRSLPCAALWRSPTLVASQVLEKLIET